MRYRLSGHNRGYTPKDRTYTRPRKQQLERKSSPSPTRQIFVFGVLLPVTPTFVERELGQRGVPLAPHWQSLRFDLTFRRQRHMMGGTVHASYCTLLSGCATMVGAGTNSPRTTKTTWKVAGFYTAVPSLGRAPLALSGSTILISQSSDRFIAMPPLGSLGLSAGPFSTRWAGLSPGSCT